jgi:hypothetical protein
MKGYSASQIQRALDSLDVAVSNHHQTTDFVFIQDFRGFLD